MSVLSRRSYQREALRAFKRLRMFALLWERQAGKSTQLSDLALLDMMQHPGRSCIYASASLLLGREIIHKQNQRADLGYRELLRKESQLLFERTKEYNTKFGKKDKTILQFETSDTSTGKIIPQIDLDSFSELFESQRLEFRIYHSRTLYSRTQVIAPNVATARSWSGTVFLDEIGFIRDFLQLWVAVEPIISTNPDFKLVMSTTPPQDDTHYVWELLAPPTGATFEPNPNGNWYESEMGIPVHRADCLDTYAAGKKVYDVRTGEEINPSEAFNRAINKDGYRSNHRLQWLIGGSAAIGMLQLKVAQERGEGSCRHFNVDTDGDLQEALDWLKLNINQTCPVGIGFDVATTTRGASNPSAIAIMENANHEYVYRCAITWKTKDPAVAIQRLHRILEAIEQRPGGRARAMAQDASNEKYFAESTRKEFRRLLPVHLIVSGETYDKPGMEKATNWKDFLGNQYVALYEDNRITCPPGGYFRSDQRLVRKDRGLFVCEPDSDGKHGDTFDAGKLAIHALAARGEAKVIAARFGTYA